MLTEFVLSRREASSCLRVCKVHINLQEQAINGKSLFFNQYTILLTQTFAGSIPLRGKIALLKWCIPLSKDLSRSSSGSSSGSGNDNGSGSSSQGWTLEFRKGGSVNLKRSLPPHLQSKLDFVNNILVKSFKTNYTQRFILMKGLEHVAHEYIQAMFSLWPFQTCKSSFSLLEVIRHFEIQKKTVCIKIVESLSLLCSTVTGSNCI